MTSTTRDRLIDAARELFAEKGYGATSIADILAVTGVNSGSLYYAFPGKQDLLVAVLESYREGIGPMLLEPSWAGIEDPVDRIFALLAQYRSALEQTDLLYGCPIGSLALELHEPDPVVRIALADNFDAWTSAISDCLAAVVYRLPPDTDRAALADLVLCTMEGGVMLARTHRNLAPFDRVVAQLRRYFDLLMGG